MDDQVENKADGHYGSHDIREQLLELVSDLPIADEEPHCLATGNKIDNHHDDGGAAIDPERYKAAPELVIE